MIILLLVFLSILGCGGNKEDSPITYKITASQSEIKHQTLINDLGSEQKANITLTLTQTQDGKESPATGAVRVTYGETSVVKVLDPNGNHVRSGDTMNINGSQMITISYQTRARPNPLDYNTIISFTFGNSISVKLTVTKPETATYTLRALPDKISDTSLLTDNGTFKTANITLTLSAKDYPIADNLFILKKGSNIEVLDIRGNSITEITTDSNGRALIVIKYQTKKDLSYNESVEVFYGNTSTTITVSVSKEEKKIIETSITPDKFEYTTVRGDAGTWRTASFIVQTTDKDNNRVSGDIEVNVTSEYLKVYGQKTFKGRTNTSGILNLDIQYYTQSTPTPVNYEAFVFVNEEIVKFTIKAPERVDTVITVTPDKVEHNTAREDAGTWRSASFIVQAKDDKGNPISTDIEVNVTSDYLKVYGQKTFKGKTSTSGLLNLEIQYYTQSIPTPINYDAYAFINDKIVKFTVKASEPEVITTTLTPTEHNHTLAGDDPGTWRTATFIVKTMSGTRGTSAPFEVKSTSTNVKIYGSNEYSGTTNSSGTAIVEFTYYTKANQKYIAYILVNESIFKVNVQ